MRRSVRVLSELAAEERLGRAIWTLPVQARQALAEVVDREDLPLVAGTWQTESGGCLVANVVSARCAGTGPASPHTTLDVRVLELIPELSSRDLNRLVVAWDEAASQQGRASDAVLRRLLRGALTWARRDHADEQQPPGTGPSDCSSESAAWSFSVVG